MVQHNITNPDFYQEKVVFIFPFHLKNIQSIHCNETKRQVPMLAGLPSVDPINEDLHKKDLHQHSVCSINPFIISD